MLRVGLTGDLGSGKSTVARMLADRGATVLSSDEMGRAMMQPGEPVFAQIVARFGPSVVRADGALDRRELARMAFSEGRVEELNAIVHPAVLAEQARLFAALARVRPKSIVVVESALIFSTRHAGADHVWSERFDRIVLVTAPEREKVARFIARAAAGRVLEETERAVLEADARRRLAAQGSAEAHAADCLVIRNDGNLEELEERVDAVWSELQAAGKASAEGVSLD